MERPPGSTNAVTEGSPERPAPPAGETANAAEPTGSAIQRAGRWIEHELERPGVGALVAGGGLIVAAATAGVSEAIVGAIGAYAVYRALKRRRAEHGGAAH